MKNIFRPAILILTIGAILIACVDEKDPVAVTTHPAGFNDKNSADFHGTVLLTESLSFASCQSCHGADYKGGTSEISCSSSGCHANYPHPENFASPASPEGHASFIASAVDWDISECQSCHGIDYSGNGFAEKNCLTCHTQPDGPEDCSTCHGGAENAAPPRDLNDNTSISLRTVGAHQIHLSGTQWSTFTTGKCESCHNVPGSLAASGHLDDLPGSEVVFNAFASFNGTLSPQWSRSDASCSNVYCHGNFEFRKEDSDYPWAYIEPVMRGNNPRMIWTSQGGGQTLCGTCHGLPPQGHIPGQNCEGCHSRVVDANFNITNPYLHINGKIEVF